MCDVCVCVCVFVCVCVCECQHQMKARADKHRREVVYSPGDIHGDAQYKNMRHGGPGVKKLHP